MKYNPVSREEALAFLNAKQIALAGASRNPKKFGNIVLKTLITKGFGIIPVHPEAHFIEKVKCYPNISELPKDISHLLIVLQPKDTEKVLEEAIQHGIRNIWIQQGSENEYVLKMAQGYRGEIITGKCILMYANPSGFHKFHRNLNRLLGKY